jgi:hypothetical protein
MCRPDPAPRAFTHHPRASCARAGVEARWRRDGRRHERRQGGVGATGGGATGGGTMGGDKLGGSMSGAATGSGRRTGGGETGAGDATGGETGGDAHHWPGPPVTVLAAVRAPAAVPRSRCRSRRATTSLRMCRCRRRAPVHNGLVGAGVTVLPGPTGVGGACEVLWTPSAARTAALPASPCWPAHARMSVTSERA